MLPMIRWWDYHDNVREWREVYFRGHTVRRNELDDTDESPRQKGPRPLSPFSSCSTCVSRTHLYKLVYCIRTSHCLNCGGVQLVQYYEFSSKDHLLGIHGLFSSTFIHIGADTRLHSIDLKAVLKGTLSATVKGGESTTNWVLSHRFSGEVELSSLTFTFTDFFHTPSSFLHLPDWFLSPFFPLFLVVVFTSCCLKHVLTHFSFVFSLLLFIIIFTVIQALASI